MQCFASKKVLTVQRKKPMILSCIYLCFHWVFIVFPNTNTFATYTIKLQSNEINVYIFTLWWADVPKHILMRLRTLEPFADTENTQQQFNFKLNHECMCHSLYIRYKMHTSFSTGKSCRTDESTEQLRVIFRSRNLVIYILN